MNENLPKSNREIFISLIQIVLVSLSYFVAGKIGLIFASFHPSATAIWPPTGIAIAAVLLVGYKKAVPAIFAAAFLVNLTTTGDIPSSVGIAIGNTLEGLVAAYLVNRFAAGKKSFQKTSDVLKFTLFAAVLSPFISASIGTLSLYLTGSVNLEMLRTVWLTWVLGDAGGALIVAPFILIWLEKFKRQDVKLKGIIECLFLLLILEIVAEIVFKGLFPYAFICLPILVWIGFRFSTRGGSIAVLVLSVITLFYTLSGVGPFTNNVQTLNESLLLAQIYLAVSTIMTLVLAVALREGWEAQLLVNNSEQRFRELIEKSKDGLALFNADGIITYAGPSTENLLGYTAADMVGQPALKFIHPEDRSRIAGSIAKVLSMPPGSSLSAEYRSPKKDGEIRWISAIGTNYLADPAINAVVVNYHDISRRKMAEEKIAREKAEDEALLESIGEGIVATDNNGLIILTNKSVQDLLGFSEDEFLGKNTLEILDFANDEGITIAEDKRPLHIAIAEKRKVTATLNLKRKNGTVLPVLVVASPVVLNNEIIGGIKVIRDITQEKAIDKAKSEFVATASHQLRTPLGIAKWYLEAIESEDYFKQFPKEAQEYIDTVYKSNERLLYIVRSLLSVARIESGHVKDEPALINVVQTVEDVVLNNKIEAQKKSISILIDDKSDKKASITIDPRRFTEVIENLLSNAIKYSHKDGHIIIRIESNEQAVLISVKDSGIGISDKDKEKIFSKFFRAENAVRTETVGSGLGLYLVKSYIYGWKGVVWFDSIEGEGTTFHVRIPRKA